MNKFVISLFFFLIYSLSSYSQDWYTSFEVAKRHALVQNKMLLVIWEDALRGSYYVLVKNERGKLVLADLKEDESITELIWEYLIPVVLPEDAYGDFLNDLNDKTSLGYMQKLEDDSIKIMDVSGKILNVNTSSLNTEDLSHLIEHYAINTSYINAYLRSYATERNFNTTYNLASKYLDLAIFAKTELTRSVIVAIVELYFEEARGLVMKEETNKQEAYIQKLELNKIKSALISGKPKKAKRLLKKYEASNIDEINKSLFLFLNYTTFMILDEQEIANQWKNELTETDLHRSTLLININ